MDKHLPETNQKILPVDFSYEIEFGSEKSAEILVPEHVQLLDFVQLTDKHKLTIFSHRLYVWIERIEEPIIRNIIHSNGKIELHHEEDDTLFYHVTPRSF